MSPLALRVEDTPIPGVKLLTPRCIGDARGTFCEVYNRAVFAAALGIDLDFVQDNVSLSAQAGTLRGLHFQAPPFAQAKLVRVARGRILDVAVDLRVSSPRFGRHVAVELSADDGRQLLVPVGFAHGFCTLEADTEVNYKVTSHWSAAHDLGLAFDDPALGIAWPFADAALTLSDRDRRHPRLAALRSPFA